MNNKIAVKTVLVLAISVFVSCKTTPSKPPENKLEIKIAGYDYDRVRAIMDGEVKHEGLDISFAVENIYSLSKSTFGIEQKYEVT